ncbi:MAG TPA: hypothetical protein VMU95_09135 [Trebonia sp.]|nr:hypothetical protein [Trebonia sp.]
MDGVVDHGGIEVGAHFDDHVGVEAAHPAVVIGELGALVGERGGQQFDDRGVVVDVKVLNLQLDTALQNAAQAPERGIHEFPLTVIAARQHVGALDRPVDVIGHARPELGLGVGALQVAEQGDAVVAAAGGHGVLLPASRPVHAASGAIGLVGNLLTHIEARCLIRIIMVPK